MTAFAYTSSSTANHAAVTAMPVFFAASASAAANHLVAVDGSVTALTVSDQ